jgi:hypothetical protein
LKQPPFLEPLLACKRKPPAASPPFSADRKRVAAAAFQKTECVWKNLLDSPTDAHGFSLFYMKIPVSLF